ncbi:hypothetical protein HYZ80_03125 [Candidatus Parcubacteria bacterium]|nr:hypothetical protein [Candidatus Parcubacteria bacterium]
MLNLLAAMPIWLTFAVLFFLCIGILPLGRRYFEGFPYNIALSNAYGDVALIVCVMIGVTVLQREGAPEWLRRNQLAIGWASVAVGVLDATVIASGIWRNTLTDTYHNLVVVSLLVYLVPLTALPVVFVSGAFYERAAFLFFGLVFAATFAYDWRTGRLQQTKWLRGNRRVTQV